MPDLNDPGQIIAQIPARAGYYLDDGDVVAVIVDGQGQWVATAVQEWNPMESSTLNATRLAAETDRYPIANAMVIPVYYGDHRANQERAAAVYDAVNAESQSVAFAPLAFSVQDNATFTMATAEDFTRWTPPQAVPPVPVMEGNPLGPSPSRHALSREFAPAHEAELIMRGVQPTAPTKAELSELTKDGPLPLLEQATALLDQIRDGQNLDRAPGLLAATLTNSAVRDAMVETAASNPERTAATIDAYRLAPDTPGRQDLACVAATASYITGGSLYRSLAILDGAPHHGHRLTELLQSALRQTPDPAAFHDTIKVLAIDARENLNHQQATFNAAQRRQVAFPERANAPQQATKHRPPHQDRNPGQHRDEPGLDR